MLRRSATLILVLASVLPAVAGKPKPRPTLVKLDPAIEQIANLKLLTPKQPCPNWAWASAVELMLARQNVVLDQTYWILKANAGEVCIENPVDLGMIRKAVEGDYVQPDGDKIHIGVVVTPGVPNDVGYLIRSIREGRPLLILWRGRPVVLQAIEFDEYIYPNNQRMYEARKLTFLDPLGEKPIVFDKATDKPSDLGGILEVRVGPIEHFR